MKKSLISRCNEIWRSVDHEVLFALAVVMYLTDVTSDIVLGATYLRNSNTWHGALTLFLVLISHIIFSISMISTLSLQFGTIDKKKFLKNLIYIFIPSPILVVIVWKKTVSYRIRRSERERVFSDLSPLRKRMSLIEVFFESILQLCLQAYIIIATQGYITAIQQITCLISLLTASFGSLSEFNGLFVKCFVFVSNIFWLFTRVVAIAMLGCIKKYLPYLFVIANFVVFFLLDFYERRVRASNRIQIGPLFASCCMFSPLFSLRPLEVATFLTFGNGIAFWTSARFGTTKSGVLTYTLENTTTVNVTANTTWISSNGTYNDREIMLSKQDASNVLLYQWYYFKPLMIVFILFSMLAIIPLAINFLLLIIKSKYHFVLKANSLKSTRLPKLLKIKKNDENNRIKLTQHRIIGETLMYTSSV